ncbi:Eukaryotic cytochrome b561 [Saprospira grandis]|uniref:Cytochrome B n=1 Tax=Saprospira grandis (strain Lewin) TaxID=984262 RepID=H6LAS6_SAPGL|nr:Eukaryotic cytochrome b561 [Saprospira grandis]AFC25669.1 hypothetical protein SGRA_2941 [Saprospira grandis str. Lewin]
MLNGLQHAHSGLRWLVLIFLLLAIVTSFQKWRANKQEYLNSDKKLPLFALIFTHTQFLIGLILYFMSPKVQFVEGMMKDTYLRFYAVEHISMMVLAVVAITIGYSRAKRLDDAPARYKTQFMFYLIGLVLMLAGIPWPFREALGAGWF